MSEYQYYEFQAVDRPLSDEEMRTLRGYSSRAAITPTRFTNSYSYGCFKGSAPVWMEKYFDAFVYLANWGTHELMLRLPRSILEHETARQYLNGEAASVRANGDFVILSFLSEAERSDWIEDEQGSGWMSALLCARSDLASGDLRFLYLGWLLSVQNHECEEAALEPPVPAGLGQLSAPLKAFADFLRIDEDLIAAAAERSEPGASSGSSRNDLERWVGSLGPGEKTDLLVRFASGGEPHLRGELLRRFRASQPERAPAVQPRSCSELISGAERLADERRQKEEKRAAHELALRERKEKAALEVRLKELAKRQVPAWQKVDALIATKRPTQYDEAVCLLRDLKEIGIRAGRSAEIQNRLQRIQAEHSTKRSLIDRLRRAGLFNPPISAVALASQSRR